MQNPQTLTTANTQNVFSKKPNVQHLALTFDMPANKWSSYFCTDKMSKTRATTMDSFTLNFTVQRVQNIFKTKHKSMKVYVASTVKC